MPDRKAGPVTSRTLKAGDVLCSGKWGSRAFYLVQKAAANSFTVVPLQWSPDAVNEPGVLVRVPGKSMPLVVLFKKTGAPTLEGRPLEFYRESYTVKELSKG